MYNHSNIIITTLKCITYTYMYGRDTQTINKMDTLSTLYLLYYYPYIIITIITTLKHTCITDMYMCITTLKCIIYMYMYGRDTDY